MIKKNSGLITFLFTDIEGSTKLSQEYPDTLQSALDLHHSILQSTFESHNGHVFEIVGDAFYCAFQNPEDALKAAVETQLNLSKVKWDDVKIKVRMGIHSGDAERIEDKYMGYITLARTARIMSAAYGGQILISSNTYDLFHETNSVLSKETGNRPSFRDLGERKLKDLIQPIQLYQVLHNNLREDFPPLKTLDARPNNLPIQLTNFIGREKEIADIKKRFENVKLITLTGPGGSGKSRLSLQIAADLIDEFENGVWFVELASLNDSFQLPQAVAKVFKLHEEEGSSFENIVLNFLKNKQALIILDNCEHLIDACAIFSEKILRNSPGLKIIATSRTALRCEGELTLRVQTLEHPDPRETLTPIQLTQYEAVRLFIERALAVNPAFRVNNENAPALAHICSQLDGIPLALELAAVRTKVLSLEKIRERLDDRFKLLTGGKRTALPRQQTLRALINWSFDLLSEKEKILWRRLSVFTDGWKLEDSENICADEILDTEEIFEITNQLIEKSVIIFLENTSKYKMLETIRQYGIEKLFESNETSEFEKKHFMYFLEMCENAKPEFVGPRTKYWLDLFEGEYPNIRSALNKCIEKKYPEEGHRFAVALSKFWELRGYFSDARNILGKLLENTQGVSQKLIANSKRLSGIFATQQGDNEIAKKFMEESIEIYRSIEDKEGISNSLNVLGLISIDIGDYMKARKLLNESLQLKRELKTEIGICSTLNSIGLVELDEGNFKQAEECFTEVLETATKIQDEMYIGIGYNNLAKLYCLERNYQKAKLYFEKCMELDTKLGNKSGLCITLANFGTMALEEKEYEEAKRHFNEGLKIGEEIGFRQGLLYSLNGLGQVVLAEGDLLKAKNIFLKGLKIMGDFNDTQVSVINLAGLAEIMQQEEKHEIAVQLIGTAKSIYEKTLTHTESNIQIIFNNIIDKAAKEIGIEKTNGALNSGKTLSFQKVNELTGTNE